MAIKLQGTARYLNKYEGAHAILSNATPFFNENAWTKIASGNDASNLDMYIYALSQSDKLDYDSFVKEYKLDYANIDTELAALYNEVFPEKDVMVEVDSPAGKRMISKYDYYKENIIKQNEYLAQQHLDTVNAEYDPSIWATIPGIVDNFIIDLDVAFTATAETFAGLANLAFDVAGVKGNKYVQGSDGKWYSQYYDGYLGLSNAPFYFHNVGNRGTLSEIPVDSQGTSFAEAIEEFNRDFTYIYDENGNLTTFGKYSDMVSQTLAQMLVASWTGGGISNAVSISGKAASALTTGIFYAPSTAQNISETYNYFKEHDMSVSTGAIVANAVFKSGLEAAIEIGIGRIFGASGLDRFIFGRGGKSLGVFNGKLSGKNTLRGILRAALNVAQEPLEEVTQEMSNVLVDNIFGLVVDEDFGELSSLTAQNLVDAAIVAVIISGAQTGIDVMRTESKTIVTVNGVQELGKFGAYDYDINMQAFAESYEEAQKLFNEAMSSDRATILPTYERLSELNERRGQLVGRKDEISNQISKQYGLTQMPGFVGKSSESVKSTIAERVGDLNTALSQSERLALNEQLKNDPNYQEIQAIDDEIKSLDSEIERTQSIINSKGFNDRRNREHNRKSEKVRAKYIDAFRQMYAAAKMLTAFSNEIGEERLNQANDILTKATQYINEGKYSPDVVNTKFNDLKTTIKLYGIVEPGPSFWQKLKESGATTISKIFSRKTHKENGSIKVASELDDAITKVFEKASKAENIVVTKDGKTAVESKDGKTISVPEKELKLGADGVMHNLAEVQLADGLVNGEYRGITMAKVKSLYEKMSGKKNVSEHEVALKLFFDTPFFSGLLSEADIDMYQFLSSLISIEKAVVAKDVRDEVYKKKVREAVRRMKGALKFYLKNQHNADYRLDIFTDAEIREIAAARWCKNLAQRVIQGVKLDKDDISVLSKRIDNTPNLTMEERKNLKKDILSDKASDRKNAMDKIANTYRDAFLGAYDGTTYMPLTSSSNKAFNYFLQSKGLTLQSLHQLSDEERKVVIEVAGNDSDTSIQEYRAEQFQDFTNDEYSYSVENGEIVTFNKDGTDYGYSYRPTKAILSGEDIPLSDDRTLKSSERTFQSRGRKYNERIKELLDKSVDDATASYLSIDDVINHYELLSKNIRDNIVETYGTLNSVNTFRYLRQHFINKTKTIGVTVLSDGTYAFVDIEPMRDVLKDDWAGSIYKIKNGVDIFDLLNDKYKIPYLEGATIMVKPSLTGANEASFVSHRVVKIDDNGKFLSEKGNIGYDSIEGTEIVITKPIIYLNPDLMSKSKDYIRFVITHEIQHAFQVANGQNIGMSGNFVSDLRFAGLSEKKATALLNKLAEDLKNHRPELFKSDGRTIKPNSAEGHKILNNFIYYCSGESTAYGLDSSELVDFYPVIVSYDGVKRTIRMPWGTTVELSNLNDITASAIGRERYNLRQDVAQEIESVSSESSIADIINSPIGSFLISSDNKVRELFDDEWYGQTAKNAVELAGYVRINTAPANILLDGTVVNPLTGKVLSSPDLENNNVIYQIEFSSDVRNASISDFSELDKILSNINISDCLFYMDGKLVTKWTSGDKSDWTLMDYIVYSKRDRSQYGKIAPYMLEEFENLVFEHGKDADVNELAPKIFDAYRKILSIQKRENLPTFTMKAIEKFPDRRINGLFTSDPSSDLYGVNVLSAFVDDPAEDTARVILHETIHAVTESAIASVEAKVDELSGLSVLDLLEGRSDVDYLGVTPDDTWTESQKGALILLQVYRHLKTVPNVDNLYGFTDVYEMVAELSNPVFRRFLKSQTFEKETLWTKVKNALFRILGFNIKDALSAVELGLEKILSAPMLWDVDSNAVFRLSMSAKSPDSADTVKPTVTPKRGRRKTVESADGAVKAVLPHVRTKGKQARKYIGSKASKGTVLEPFAGRKLGEKLTQFIVKSAQPEYKGIDADLAKKIKNGTITTQDIMSWFFQVDTDDVGKSDEITFNLINDSIFHNKFITSFKQLDEYIQVRTANMWVMRSIMNELGHKDKFAKVESPEMYDAFFEIMESNKALQKKFESKLKEFTIFEALDFRNLRRLWMQWYDGSVASGGYIGGVAKAGAEIISRHGSGWSYSSGKAGSISLSQGVGKSKEGKTTRTREEVTASKEDYDDLLSVATEDQLYVLQEAYKVFLAKQIKEEVESNPEYSSMDKIPLSVLAEQANRIKEAMFDIEHAYYYDKSAFKEMYVKYVLNDSENASAIAVQAVVDELAGEAKVVTSEEFIKEREDAREALKVGIRTKGLIVNNIRSINRTIKTNLNKKQRKLFLRDYGEIFDENLDVKKELYQIVTKRGGDKVLVRLKDESKLLELEDVMREASSKVRQGVYDNEDFYNYRRKQDRRMDDLIVKLTKASKTEVKTVEKVKEKIVYINQHDFRLDTDVEVPKAIETLLSTTLTETAKTDVKLLANDNERHFVMNLENFIVQNIESISSWTQEDINKIIEFYSNSGIMTGTNMATLYSTVEQLTLAYLLRMDGKEQVMFRLTDEQREFAVERLKNMASKAGTELHNWQEILKSFKAEGTFVQAAMKISDIELSPATQGELEMALNSGDMRRIQAAKERAYNEVVESYRGRERTVWSQLLRFERMAMLSSPGTWVRNQASNVVLTAANSLTDLMSRMFPQGEKAKKLNQYKIAGTKIDEQYRTWVQTQMFDSGFIKLLGDAMSKYDVRKKDVSNTDILVALITEKIETELFNKESFRSMYSDNKFVSMFGKGMQFSQWFTNFVMQDTWAINHAFKKYLGKMMTEDKVDIGKGLTKEVMNTIADAYVMAAQDFMHKAGMWSKLEHALKTYLNNNFGQNKGDIIYFMYKQIFPFGGSAWNWFVDSLEFTPVGLVKGITNILNLEKTVRNMEEARRKGEKVRSSRFAAYIARRQLSRGIIGTFTLGLGILLNALGVAGVDEDDDEAKLVFNTKDGPMYLDIRSVYGTSGLLAGITLAQGAKDGKTLTKIFGDVLTSMFHESTFSDVFNSFRYNETFGDYLVDLGAELPSMFVPRFISGTLGIASKYKVQYGPGVKGSAERFLLNVMPLLSYAFTHKINPYTGDDEVVNDAWFVSNLVNKLLPVKIKNYAFGNSEKEAVRLGIKKTQLSGRYEVDGEKLSLNSKELRELNSFYGKLNKLSLDKLMSDKVTYTVEDEDGKRVELKYSKMTDKQKAAVIERIMSNNSGYAKAYILTSSGQYKYYASDSEYEVLKSLGLKNVYRQVGKYKGYVKN